MGGSIPKPQGPTRTALDVLAEKAALKRGEEKQAERMAQASAPEVLEAQLNRENAFRKMLQKMRDQKNGN